MFFSGVVMNFNNEKHGFLVKPCIALAAFLIMWFFAWQNGQGQEVEDPDSSWVQAESLVEESPPYKPKAVYHTCPHCGKCKPKEYGAGSVTLMGCPNGCCNTATWYYECETTGESITVKINECDYVIWLVKKDSAKTE